MVRFGIYFGGRIHKIAEGHERKRDVQGNSKVWDLNNWVNGAPFIAMGKAATGWWSQVRVGQGHREDDVRGTTEGPGFK